MFEQAITELVHERFGDDVHVQSVTDETAGVLSIYVWRAVENRRHVLSVSTQFAREYEGGELLV